MVGSLKSAYFPMCPLVSSPARDFGTLARKQSVITAPGIDSILPFIMATGYSKEETKALIKIWGATSVQSQLDGVRLQFH